MAELAIIDRSVEKAHVWLGEVAEELGTVDRQQAYRVLRAYLQALRDRLPVDEVAQLAAQLPELIRGMRRHVSPGELDDVRAVLPEELRAILS